MCVINFRVTASEIERKGGDRKVTGAGMSFAAIIIIVACSTSSIVPISALSR